MGAIVKYRDLPGGPTDVRMGDELSRYCLCTQCGMLSMSAYQDLHGHVFCDDCIQERSYKHHKYDIFCKYEQRNVSLNEMFEANDVVTVIRDQFTFCPNKNCEERVPLEALIDHYCQCTPQVHCVACRKTVPSREWKAHWQKHLIPGHGEPTPMETNQKQQPMESSSGNQSYKRESQTTTPSNSRQFSGSNCEHFAQFPIPPASRNATRSSGSPSKVTRICRFPASQLSASNHLATGDATSKSPCDYCGRFVKEVNMAPHLEKCSKAPQTCVYCDKKVLKEDIPAHSRQCDQNPDNCNAIWKAAVPASIGGIAPVRQASYQPFTPCPPTALFWPENTARSLIIQSQVAPGMPYLLVDRQEDPPWWLRAVLFTILCAVHGASNALHLCQLALAFCTKVKNTVRNFFRALHDRFRPNWRDASRRARRFRQWHSPPLRD